MGAASLAAGTVYFGRFGRDVPLVLATAVQLGAAAILTVALTIVFEHPHASWTFPAVASGYLPIPPSSGSPFRR